MSGEFVGQLALKRYKAEAFLVVTAVLWSLGGLLIKLVSWNPIAIAGARSAISALLLLAFLRRPRFTWSFAQIGGAVAYAVTVILFVVSNKLTTAANAILLQYTAPIYTAIFGVWLLGERTSWRDWATIVSTVGGIALFFLDDLTPGGFWGNVCAITSGVAFGLLPIFMRKQRAHSPLESILLGNTLAAVFGLPFMFESMPNATSWGGLALLGTIQLGLPYILYSIAIKHVTALEAMLITAIEPILNPLWVFLLIGEVPGPFALLGGIVVLASITARLIIAASSKTAKYTSNFKEVQ
ncbi:MAG: DMT family transporter [bacterium]